MINLLSIKGLSGNEAALLNRNLYGGINSMKTVKKILAAVLAAAVIAACFAGCSGDAANSAKAQVKVIDIALSDEEYAFGVDKNQPELMEQVNAFIKEIKENGRFDEICNKYFASGEPTGVTSAAEDSSKDQLVVATNAEFEPFEYKEGDQFYGIDMEIASLLAQKLNNELVIIDMAFDSVLLSVQQGKADIGMAGLTVTEERAQQVDFSDSYYSASQKVIAKADDTTFDSCKTKADVDAILKGLDAGVTIGGQNGTTGQYYVEGSEDFGFEKLNATWKGYANGSLAVQDLLNGGVNYVIIDAAPAAAITTAINAVA